MKKSFFYLLLLAALPILGFTSCSDDDDLPNVDFNLEISGGVSVDGVIYVVQGDTLSIDAVNVTNVDSKKSAIITAATYYWDAFRLGISTLPPYGFNIVTGEGTSLGKHELAIECPVYAVDKSPAIANVFYPVQIVADAADIPTGDTPAVTTFSAPDHMLAY